LPEQAGPVVAARETTTGELLRDAATRLSPVSATPVLDAEVLLGHVLGRSRAWLRAHGEQPVTARHAARLESLLARRLAGEPVAYLTGRRGFWTLELEVDPAVLVPRPETELLVEAAVEALRGQQTPAILDLGTGSGAVALALAAELPDAEIVAVDTSVAALAVARRNAAAAGLGRVTFLPGHWFEPVGGRRFDAVVSNPPYLAVDDPHLATLGHEPPGALVAGPTGLEALEAIIAGASAHLLPGGLLLLEHGRDQGPAVRALCLRAGFGSVETLRDLAGLERVTRARRAASGMPAG
jgi:release factor glutamine methyltransferase